MALGLKSCRRNTAMESRFPLGWSEMNRVRKHLPPSIWTFLFRIVIWSAAVHALGWVVHAEKWWRATHKATTTFICVWSMLSVTACTAAAAISSWNTPATTVKCLVHKMLNIAEYKSRVDHWEMSQATTQNIYIIKSLFKEDGSRCLCNALVVIVNHNYLTWLFIGILENGRRQVIRRACEGWCWVMFRCRYLIFAKLYRQRVNMIKYRYVKWEFC